MHIHPHLTIIINGQVQVIPAGIGIEANDSALPLHTHDATGKIHIESPVVYDFTLQDFFTIWGQPFNDHAILNHPTNAARRVTVMMTVNGQPSTAFGSLVLHDLDNIVINAVETVVPTQTTVAGLFTHCAENYGNVVAQAYQEILGRSPDPGGRSYWVGQMQHGMTDERLEASLLTSAEYVAKHGATDRAWLQGVYEDLFGRAPDEAGLNFWAGRLAAGTSRDAVALAFTSGTEREALRITDAYRTYLGRDPEAAGLRFWLDGFAHGLTNEGLVAGILSSDEYYQGPTRGHGDRATWVRSAYRDLLHRAAGDGEVAFWLTVLAQQ
jgi:hypothetical protein